MRESPWPSLTNREGLELAEPVTANYYSVLRGVPRDEVRSARCPPGVDDHPKWAGERSTFSVGLEGSGIPLFLEVRPRTLVVARGWRGLRWLLTMADFVRRRCLPGFEVASGTPDQQLVRREWRRVSTVCTYSVQ
jgi:hypothetical protein